MLRNCAGCWLIMPFRPLSYSSIYYLHKYFPGHVSQKLIEAPTPSITNMPPLTSSIIQVPMGLYPNPALQSMHNSLLPFSGPFASMYYFCITTCHIHPSPRNSASVQVEEVKGLSNGRWDGNGCMALKRSDWPARGGCLIYKMVAVCVEKHPGG